MLYSFNHSIHNSSDAPCFRGLHTFWTNGSFYLYLDNCIFILILLYYLVFALVLNTVDIALVKFSF